MNGRPKIDDAGWVEDIPHIPSPNFDARPGRQEISLLVIHNISLPPDVFTGDGVARLFTNTLDPNAHPYFAGLANLKVSSHFFIRRDGSVIQFVSCLDRAWHAGLSVWKGKTRCNDFSIGIELEGSDTLAFDDAQYLALKNLTLSLQAAYPIRDIAGHADIAPDRKTDPGPYFDWARYLSAVDPIIEPPACAPEHDTLNPFIQ